MFDLLLAVLSQEYQATPRPDPPPVVRPAETRSLEQQLEELINQDIKRLELHIESNPDDVNSRCRLGILYHKKNRLDDAEAQFKKALELNPKHLGARQSIAVFYLGQGKIKECESHLREAIRLNPKHPGARYFLGLHYLCTRRPGLAAPQFEEVIDLRPKNQKAYLAKALTYILANNLELAKTSLDRLLSIDPNNEFSFLFYGIIHTKEGENEQALDAYRNAGIAGKILLATHYWHEEQDPETAEELLETVSQNKTPTLLKYKIGIYNSKGQEVYSRTADPYEAAEAALLKIRATRTNDVFQTIDAIGKFTELFHLEQLPTEINHDRLFQMFLAPLGLRIQILPGSILKHERYGAPFE